MDFVTSTFFTVFVTFLQFLFFNYLSVSPLNLAKQILKKKIECNTLYCNSFLSKGSSINEVSLFSIILDTPSPPLSRF